MSSKSRSVPAGVKRPPLSRFPAYFGRVMPLGLAALLLTGTTLRAAGEVTGVLESSGSGDLQWQSAYLMSEPAPDSKVVSQVAKGTTIVIHPERSTDQYYCVDIQSPSGPVQGFVWKQFVRPPNGVPLPVASSAPASAEPPAALPRVGSPPSRSVSTSDLRLRMMPAPQKDAESEPPAAEIAKTPPKKASKKHKEPAEEADAPVPGPAALAAPIKELRKLRSKLESELEDLPQGKMDKAAMAQMDRLVTCLNDVLEMERATTKAFEGTSVVMSSHQKAINELQEKVARLSASSGSADGSGASGDVQAQVSQLRKTVLDMSVRVADSRAQGAKIKGLEQKLARLERLVKKLDGEPAVQVVARADPELGTAEIAEPEPTLAPRKRRKYHAKKKAPVEDDTDDPEEPREKPDRPIPNRDAGLTTSQGTGATNVADIAVGEAKEKPAPPTVGTAPTAIKPLPPTKTLSQTQIQTRLAHLLKIVRTHQVQGKPDEKASPQAVTKGPSDLQDDPAAPEKVASASEDSTEKVAQRPAPRRQANPVEADDDDPPPAPKPKIAPNGTPKEKMSINQIERIMNARL